MTPLEIIKTVAEKSIGHGPQILAYLGVSSIESAMGKRKFALPGCNCDKPKARLSDPEKGKGGLDSCQCFKDTKWNDFVRMVRIVKGLSDSQAAI